MKGGEKYFKMKTENNFWKTFAVILIVVIVVGAVVVFWRNPELSPNGGVIKVQKSNYGTEIYTKAEIDAMFNNIARSFNTRDLVVENDATILRNVSVWGQIGIAGLSGIGGNAYVCVDYSGKLLRSATPCR